MSIIVNPIVLDEFVPGRSLQPLTQDVLARTQGRVTPLRVGGKDWLLPQVLLDRAATYSVERLCDAATEAAALCRHDQPVLARCGLDAAWVASLVRNIEALRRLSDQKKSLAARAEVHRVLGSGVFEEAQALVRRVGMLAMPAGVRQLLGGLDWQSESGIIESILQIAARVEVESLRKDLFAFGVTEEMIGRAAALRPQLLRERDRRTEADTEARLGQLVLQVAKGLLLGELLLLSNTARAELAEERWGLYQMGRLLDVPARSRRPAEPEGPPAPPSGPPASGPGVTPAPAPPSGPPPLAGAPLPELRPGTVLTTLPAAGGPSLAAVVQPDRSIAWVPLAPAGSIESRDAPRPPRKRRRPGR